MSRVMFYPAPPLMLADVARLASEEPDPTSRSAVPLVRLEPVRSSLLMRPGEVAQALSISRSKVYELIAAGVLPGVVRVTGLIRISRAALERWIAAECERA